MTQVNLAENLSFVKFHVLLDSQDQVEKMKGLCKQTLNSIEVNGAVAAESIPIDDEHTKIWFTYTSFVPSAKFSEAQTIFQEIGADLALDAGKYGFPAGSTFKGVQSELLPNTHQSVDGANDEFDSVQSHLISNVYDHHIRSVLLLRRVANLESVVQAQKEEIKALTDNLRSVKVMNFDYNQFHKLPQFMVAIVEAVGDEKLKRKFDDLFEEAPFEVIKIH